MSRHRCRGEDACNFCAARQRAAEDRDDWSQADLDGMADSAAADMVYGRETY